MADVAMVMMLGIVQHTVAHAKVVENRIILSKCVEISCAERKWRLIKKSEHTTDRRVTCTIFLETRY